MAKAMSAKKTTKRGRGRPRGMGPAPRQFKDRFQKFYYEHRDRLNNERRRAYLERKQKGICVRCAHRSARGSVFCPEHRDKSRAYNRGDEE